MRRGLELYRQGALEEASAEWLRAAKGYHEHTDAAGEARALMRAAQARAALGFHQEAASLLSRALETAPNDRPTLRAVILGAAAANWIDLGMDRAADESLQAALRDASASDAIGLEARLLQTRGDLLARAGETAAAADAHRRSGALAARAGLPLLAGQAGASLARLEIEQGETESARATLQPLLEGLRALPATDEGARLAIHVGSSFEALAAAAPPESPAGRQDLEQAAASYLLALETAETARAARTASYALGHLGSLEERHGDLHRAIALTRRAIASAQALEAPEISYRWQWQLGRLQRALGNDEAALDGYRRAADSLDGLRAANGAAGLDFATQVEPVYHGLVDILLGRSRAASSDEARSTLLTDARDELEKLKSAELTDYFQDACVAPETTISAAAIPGAAIVYPIILPDRTELLWNRAGKTASVQVDVRADDLNAKIRHFREVLPLRTSRAYRRTAAELYDLLIRPIEAEILSEDVETVVFVPGGALRTIPMAALYDREDREFLIEKRAVAVIPALSLTEPRSLDRERVNTLRAGLTKGVQGFTPLAAVASELESVEQVFGGRLLLDETFVAPAIEAALGDESFGIVHIATHGQFSARAEDSFLLTYDGRIGMEQLGALVERTRYQEEPIELLTLSACETAVGDDRAALGLAGVAIRAGARSALATLWTVNDQASADLIAEFYRQLAEPGTSKAQALRRAQLSLLETRTHRHPGYWASFLMISNWM